MVKPGRISQFVGRYQLIQETFPCNQIAVLEHMKRLKISLVFVAAHTVLLLVTAGAMFFSRFSHNPDSSIGFAMMCITFYVVDYPIGFLFEASRPYFSAWGGWLPTTLILYGVMANLMWFIVGIIVHLFINFFRSRKGAAAVCELHEP
jgi:hypothetical protein